jgi:chromosomal replication initiator protein
VIAAVAQEEPTSPVRSFGHYCVNPPDLPPVRPRFTSDGHLMQLDPLRCITIVANAYEVSLKALYGRNKTPTLAEARGVAHWLLRQATKLSMKEIGAAMHRPDHTSTLWGVKQCTKKRASSEQFRQLTDKLLAEAKGTVPA